MHRFASMAAAAFAATAAAQDARRPLHVADPAQWGHVTHLVEPAFPKRALDEGRGGYVDIRGRVTAHGLLDQVTYSPDKPESGIFIDPLRRVLREWRFQPPLGRDCQPSSERVVNRVLFEVEGGRPRVAVALQPGPARQAGTIAPLRREEPARRPGWVPAIVYARMQVDPSGSVVSVEPRSYVRRGTPGIREIEHEVIRVLTQWKFPAARESAANRYVCYPVRLR